MRLDLTCPAPSHPLSGCASLRRPLCISGSVTEWLALCTSGLSLCFSHYFYGSLSLCLFFQGIFFFLLFFFLCVSLWSCLSLSPLVQVGVSFYFIF